MHLTLLFIMHVCELLLCMSLLNSCNKSLVVMYNCRWLLNLLFFVEMDLIIMYLVPTRTTVLACGCYFPCPSCLL